MRSYLVIRHVASTLAISFLLALPYLIARQPLEIPKLLFWSALASAAYLYYRVRKLGFLPAYDNLNISVVAVLGISFAVFQVAAQIAGLPSPLYAGHTIVAHLYDYGFIRFEMGYAAAVAVVLFILTFVLGRWAMRVFGERD